MQIKSSLTREFLFFSSVNDNGDAKFTSLAILPQRAPVGSTILIDYIFVSKNGTGTGEIVLSIDTVDKLPLSASFLMEAKKPGGYGERVSVDASPDPDCDPTEGKNVRRDSFFFTNG